MAQAIYTIDALNILEIKAVAETARKVVYEIGEPGVYCERPSPPSPSRQK